MTVKNRPNNDQMEGERLDMLQNWLADHLEMPMQTLSPLAGDASFRRYFRVSCRDTSYVVMDAPPGQESCEAFIAIAKTFSSLGLNVPVIYNEDVARGFLLMTDFGDQLYLSALTKANSDALYQRALDDLLLIQSCQNIEGYVLPKFDHDAYLQEMILFREWYLHQHLQWSLSSTELEMLDRVYTMLAQDALSQPQVCVHRDYHSRNLMVVDEESRPGLLDFQDAVKGPITYDLLSLLRDCYIDWPASRVEKWVLDFQQQALQAGLLVVDNPAQFLRWFDWVGLQRHLKCIGIFARLNERDNRSDYLQYIPRVLNYMRDVCDRYAEFSDLRPFLDKCRRASV